MLPLLWRCKLCFFGFHLHFRCHCRGHCCCCCCDFLTSRDVPRVVAVYVAAGAVLFASIPWHLFCRSCFCFHRCRCCVVVSVVCRDLFCFHFCGWCGLGCCLEVLLGFHRSCTDVILCVVCCHYVVVSIEAALTALAVLSFCCCCCCSLQNVVLATVAFWPFQCFYVNVMFCYCHLTFTLSCFCSAVIGASVPMSFVSGTLLLLPLGLSVFLLALLLLLPVWKKALVTSYSYCGLWQAVLCAVPDACLPRKYCHVADVVMSLLV